MSRRIEIPPETIAKARVIQRVMATPDGQQMLKAMEDVFENVPLFAEDAHRMAYRVGQRDVLQWMKSLNDLQREESVHELAG